MERVKKIPYRETRSYQDMVKAIGNPKACRAVGMANHKFPNEQILTKCITFIIYKCNTKIISLI